MSKLKRSVVALASSALAAVGMTVVTGAPAGATPGNTTLVCTPGTIGSSGAPSADCTLSDPDGIRTVAIKVAEPFFNQTVVTQSYDCSAAPTDVNFQIIAGSRYKVFVTDCEVPRDKATFVIRANGSTP